MRHSKLLAWTGAASAAVLLLTACGSDSDTETPKAGDKLGGTVSVIGSWSGAEQDSFLAMVAPWEKTTGTKVKYTGSRDLNAQLTTGVASGNLPDLAGLPGPGAMRTFYDKGALKSLDFVDFDKYSSSTPAGFADLGKAEDGKLVGIFTKAAVKGLVFYNTKGTYKPTTPPKTLDELNSAARTGPAKQWCIGLESGNDSGWPATDWVEDIVLRQSGKDVYDKWVKGEQKWTSPEIKKAFETFGDALDNSNGGSNYVTNTGFGKSANPMFANPQGCLLHHQASFITDFFKNEAGAKDGDFDFFPFPDIEAANAGAVTGGGDLFGMFNDTPQARSLINYLLTPEAQAIWVKRGGFISGNKNVAIADYPDATSKKSAEILQDAKTFRFDGSDLMPAAMTGAFNKAMVAFAANQGKLDSILDGLDKTQADAYNE